MQDDFLDIETMVNKTFQELEHFSGLNPFDLTNEEETKEAATYPTSAGILYRLDLGLNTFCIRIHPTENIKNSCQQLSLGDESILKSLRLNDKDDEYIFNVYPLEDLEIAKIIESRLANFRIPMFEDSLCNISDPGFNWWYEDHENIVKIHFKSLGLSSFKNGIKLGPLADYKSAKLNLPKLLKFISGFANIGDCYCSDTQLILSDSSESGVDLDELRNVFLNGEIPSRWLSNIKSVEDQELFNYLYEFTEVRKLWLEVEAQVQESIKSIKGQKHQPWPN